MKKFLIHILCIGIILSLAGCAHPTADNPTDATFENSTENTIETTQNEIQQKPMVAVCVPTISESELAQDGTTVFYYTYQHMSLIVPDPEVADKVIIDFLNRVDEATEQAESIRSAAKAAYRPGDAWNPYLCRIVYEPIRIDNSILSLYGSYVSYNGSAHPETIYQSVNYDLLSGKALTLSDIITPETSTDTLYQKIVDTLKSQKNKNLYTDYESTVKDRFSHGVLTDKSWYLSSTGLCFYFSPYEIAPYASGVITAEIPYSELTGILDDAYFPAEQESANGSVLARNYHEDLLKEFSQFAELILDEDGEKFLLHTDKSVYDIRLTARSGSPFSATDYTVFATFRLTPGDALVVQTQCLNKTEPLILTYRTQDDKMHQYYLYHDSDNGIPTLTPA